MISVLKQHAQNRPQIKATLIGENNNKENRHLIINTQQREKSMQPALYVTNALR